MNLSQLLSEQANPLSIGIEKKSISDITSYINQEDAIVAHAVQKALPAINNLIGAAIETLSTGGRIIYVGAGTSGRLGILDASECPPTFGVSPDVFQGIIAGGESAIRAAQEGSEDNQLNAELDLQAIHVSQKDMIIGLAASGRTPYVMAALAYAKSLGAKTGSISCTWDAKLSEIADWPIKVIVGPEVITGSSRMKAGTAQKMILNMISTTSMIKLGKIIDGYMVDLQASNEKLVVRALNIIEKITSCTSKEASLTFEAANRDVKTAILMRLGQLSYQEAQQLLALNNNNVAKVIHDFSTTNQD